MNHFIKILISFISLLLVIGCAGKTPKDMPQSGFLSEYTGFHFDPMESADWIYINTKTDFKAYDKLMIHHVTYFFKEDAEYKGIQSDQLNELTEIINSTLLMALSDVYTITDKAGKGTMRLRLAVTDLVTTRPVAGTFTTVISSIVDEKSPRKEVKAYIDTKSISIEAELLDSLTNERLAAVIDQKVAQKHKLDKSVQKWGHAKDMFRQWTDNFRRRVYRLKYKRY
jgi:hypothetical protein